MAENENNVNYTYCDSKAAVYLNELLLESNKYIRERISNKIRKYFELINEAKGSTPRVKKAVHKYILNETKIGTIGATKLQNSLFRNVVVSKSRELLK